MKKERASASVVKEELKRLRAMWGWTPGELVAALKATGKATGKGSNYEREICKELSLWWTAGVRDDVFWRSSGSGARAKVRGRAGNATMGQHGDIAATDPIGAPLIDILTIEIKRGYSQATFQDVLDKPQGAGRQVWDGFFDQTIESHELAGSYAWALITRRDRREAMVWYPLHFHRLLRSVGAPIGYGVPYVQARVDGAGELCAMPLGAWLRAVTPGHIMTITAMA